MKVDFYPYVNSKLTLKKSEAATGLGVFALQDIEQGELLVASKAFAFASELLHLIESNEPNYLKFTGAKEVVSFLLRKEEHMHNRKEVSKPLL